VHAHVHFAGAGFMPWKDTGYMSCVCAKVKIMSRGAGNRKLSCDVFYMMVVR
jgi:hypothetical protein